MWLIPILLLGVVAVAAASKSPRETAPAPRQLPPSPSASPVHTSGAPSPIAVLGEFLRIGQQPPPMVIFYAIAEAEATGHHDLASDLVCTFGPIMDQLAASRGASPARGSCAPAGSPRAQADSCAPPRASCAPKTSCAPKGTCAPATPAVPASAPQIEAREPSQDEIMALLHTDPQAFLSMVESQQAKRGPQIEVFPVGTPPPRSADQAPRGPQVEVFPVGTPPPRSAPVPTSQSEALASQLVLVPGCVGAGVIGDVFEVRWLPGYPVPPLPYAIDGRKVSFVAADGTPVAQAAPAPAATQVPPQTDFTQSMGPGSPIAGVSDDAWRIFAARLRREDPTFSSSRHVGQYRQHRDRLTELGIDPRAIQSPAAQRAALDADLADAHRHAAASGMLREHLGRLISVPGSAADVRISLSGVLGVIQCAGLEGAVGWLENPGDRKRYPHTTQAFLNTNGAF